MINKKIETITHFKNEIAAEGRLHPGKFLPFQTEEIKKLSLEVLDQFKPEEKLALDSIRHHMVSIDELLNEIDNRINKFTDLHLEVKKGYVGRPSNENAENMRKMNVEIQSIIATIKNRYEEALINLNNLDKSTDHFLKGNFQNIITQI